MSRQFSGQLDGAAGQPVAWDLHAPAAGSGSVPALVVCHGFKGFKDWGFFPWLADALAVEGLAVLRFNFSHNGAGLGDEATSFTRLDLFEQDRLSYRLHDLETVTRALAGGELVPEVPIDGDRLVVFGHSLGGAAALLALSRLPFAAIVTLASVGRVSFPPDQEAELERNGRVMILNGRTGQLMPVGRAALDDLREHGFDLDVAAQHDRPWLLIHGAGDLTVPLAAADHLAAHARAGGLTRLTLEGEDADHVLGCSHPFAESTAALRRAKDEIVAFLRTQGFLGSGD